MPMLPATKRLRAHEVEEVLSRGRSVRGTHLSVKFLAGSEPLRVAAIVPKAVARRAHERNRLRRALYDSFTSLPPCRGRALFFVRAIPQQPLRTVFKEEVAALIAKIN